MPKLLLKFNAAVIKEVPLDKEGVSVGRKPDNDIVIDNPAISGHHCKITLEGGTYYVEDLDSTNGTYVNQKRVKKSGLHDNDVVGIAKHALVFQDESSVAQAPAAPQDEPVEKGAPGAPAKDVLMGKVGLLKILKGLVGDPEYTLKGASTYIGKSDRVQVQIKGSGLFGNAPEVAASIHRKPEGYVLMAVEAGFPVVNGKQITGSVTLKDGDFIDCGGTTMQFILKEAKA